MHKWIFLRFSLILSFTIFQDLKVSAVPSPQTPDPQLIGVHCAKQFGGYWDIPEYTIACKDASLNKYICNQASCFVGPLPPSPSQAYDFWDSFQLTGCYAYYGREFVQGIITPTTIQYNPDQTALVVRGFRKIARGVWERAAIKDLFICPIPDGMTHESIMPSCTQCGAFNWLE